MSALQHTSANVPISMTQEALILVDDSGLEHGNKHIVGEEDHNDEDVRLIELTRTGTASCIDFGSHLHLADEFSTLTYNPYNMIIPRVKELVSIIAASENSRERGVLIERILDDLISKEKENLALQQPSTRGQVVSACAPGKVKRTKVSQWNP